MLEILVPRFKAVAAKRSGLALVLYGEPGLGKSWTVAQLLGHLGCRSFSLHAARPLRQAVTSWPRPRRLPSWADGALSRLERGEALEPAALVDTLNVLFSALAPVVLHLEDLHEAEAVRLELWRNLAASVQRSKGVALLATSRFPPPEPFEGERLRGLSAAASQALLEREVGAPLPTPATAWIYARAGGNPLFTLEYFRYLARLGHLWNDTERWHWRAPPEQLIPTTIEALIEQLLERIGDGPSGAILEAAALLPVGTPAARIFEVAGVPEGGPAALRELEGGGLFVRETFAHPLFREVALRHLSLSQRHALSQRALGVFAAEPQTAAGFIGEAGLEREGALELLGRATAAAQQSGSPYTAARFQAQAVDYADGGARAQFALGAARVLQHYDLPEALRLCEEVLTSPDVPTEIVLLYTQLLAQQGRVPEIEPLLARLPPHLKPAEPVGVLITAHHQAGDQQRALELWEAHPELHARPAPELLRAVAGSALAAGRVEQAQALVERGLSLGGELRREFLSLQALIHYHQSRYAEAERAIGAVLALPELTRNPRARSSALVNRAAFLRMLGRYTEMGACLEEALALRGTSGDAKAYAFAQAALAELRLEQGLYSQAEDLLQEAIATLERYGPSRFLTSAHAMMTLLYTAQGTPLSRVLALKYGTKALHDARTIGSPRLVRESLFEASVAHTFAGQPQRGLELAEEAQSLAEAAGNSPQDNLRSLWAVALAADALGESERALSSLRCALQIAQPEGELEAQKLALELDRLEGNAVGAQARLAWFSERGLGHGVNLVHRYFPSLAPQASRSLGQAMIPLRLEVLGPMRVVRADRVQGDEPRGVHGKKRQELLALLLEARLAGRSEVGDLTLTDTLYPEEPDTAALSSLKQLVFQTRKGLGEGVIARTTGGYALGALTTDAEIFLLHGDTRLWRGVYLAGTELEREASVQHALYTALRRVAEGLLETDAAEAARLGQLLLEADPYDASALRLALRALTGDSRSLARVYARSRHQFAEVGEVLPDTWTDFLAALIADTD